VRATCGTRSGGGLLLIGPPGVGKTTLLRDMAHMLSEAMDREVVIVDTRWVGLGPCTTLIPVKSLIY
jgi:stage III sporulation protein SpoIIIAA